MKSLTPVLTPEEVMVYIQDDPSKNHLLDGLEFNPTQVALSIELAVAEFNMVQPLSSYTLDNFPNKAILMNGTLYKLYSGQAALLARNTMNYSDGGLQIPVEERYQLYAELSLKYQRDFLTASSAFKISTNIEQGWGAVPSDYSKFPNW